MKNNKNQIQLDKIFLVHVMTSNFIHKDDIVDLFYHCNVLLSLFSVSGFQCFKKHTSQGTLFSGCF